MVTVQSMQGGETTRRRLIDATIDVIAMRGDAAVRLVEVAVAAGIKQSSIYYFFPTREDLVIAAHRERYRRSVAETLESFEAAISGATSLEGFREGAIRALEFAFSNDRRNARLIRMTLLSKAVTNDELRREVNDAAYEGHTALAEVLERAQLAGWIRTDVSALTIAIWIRSMVFGRLVLEVDPQRYDEAEWNRLAISSFVRTLTAD
jgi:TetR/AcrR family transcriptional regulator